MTFTFLKFSPSTQLVREVWLKFGRELVKKVYSWCNFFPYTQENSLFKKAIKIQFPCLIIFRTIYVWHFCSRQFIMRRDKNTWTCHTKRRRRSLMANMRIINGHIMMILHKRFKWVHTFTCTNPSNYVFMWCSNNFLFVQWLCTWFISLTLFHHNVIDEETHVSILN